MEGEDSETKADIDPYAWAKNESNQQQQAAAVQPQQQVAAPQPVQQSQHPGWIWDAATNQWVPDPNYQPATQVVQNITYNISDSAISGDIGIGKEE